jgi:hypothetical protein
VKSLVCSSCGFIHNFIDIQAPEAGHVTGPHEIHWVAETEFNAATTEAEPDASDEHEDP